jgi:hypothetical protein
MKYPFRIDAGMSVTEDEQGWLEGQSPAGVWDAHATHGGNGGPSGGSS